MANTETARIKKDAIGNILVDQTGHVTCISEGGLEFQFPYKEIDFNCDNILCTVDDKEILIQLNDDIFNNTTHNNVNQSTINQQNQINNEVVEANRQEAFSWTDASTKLFLSLYKENVDLVTQRKIKTKRILWLKITELMKLQNYNVSAAQVENKYKSLERSFKNVKTHNKKTGRNKIACPYETELTELLGGKHSIEPLLLSGNKGIISNNNERASTSTSFINEDNNNIIASHQAAFESNANTTHNKSTLQQETYESTYDSENTYDTSDKENIKTSKMKSHTKKSGTTARVLEVCQQHLENVTDDIRQKNKNQDEIQKTILEEYKAMRKIHEEGMIKMQEQLIIANTLREEKNKLLRDFLEMQKK